MRLDLALSDGYALGATGRATTAGSARSAPGIGRDTRPDELAPVILGELWAWVMPPSWAPPPVPASMVSPMYLYELSDEEGDTINAVHAAGGSITRGRSSRGVPRVKGSG